MKVSVICAADRPRRLPGLVWSLMAQTYQDWDLLILDQSDEDVCRYLWPIVREDARIRVQRVEHVGDWGQTAKARAVRDVDGDALLFPADDAYYVPTALALLVGLLEQGHDLALCAWLYDLMGYVPMPPHPAVGHVDVGGFLVRREAFERVGWQDRSQTGDGRLVEALVTSGATVGSQQGVLYVKN